jgi:hypothetical protein
MPMLRPQHLILLAALQAWAALPTFVTGKVRVEVLSPTLVRVEERNAVGAFEDRPTFHVASRDWPGAKVRHTEDGAGLRIEGPGWTLRIPRDAQRVDQAEIRDGGGRLLWSGATKAPARAWLPGPAEATRAWALADAPRIVPPAWGLAPAPGKDHGWDLKAGANDVYVFLPGGDYRRLRKDVLHLTGPAELPPLFAFGLFHSRYWAYSDQEALTVARTYREHGFPLDVLVVDTDWRVGASVGYQENTKLFPDMDGFFRKAHAEGLRVMFNDHPEPQAEEALDPKELAWRRDGLMGWLSRGLDIWWFDRNWWVALKEPAPGLRKEVWGMALYHDMTRAAHPGLRPLIMANVDGIDNGHLSGPPDPAAHRYPIQWTGDTLSDWPFLAHGVENAIHEGVLALNPYVGEDLTGHVGSPSTEFYLRFLEFGTLSPTLRIHSNNGPAYVREPWNFGPGEPIARDYVNLRYRLMPVIYAAARRAYDEGEPLLRRLDLAWPGHPEAAREDQYLLGDHLLVAPMVEGDPVNPTVPQDLLRTPAGAPGIHAEYFRGKEIQGEPVAARDEAVLHFDAKRADLPAGVDPAACSARWTATLTPDHPMQVGLSVDGLARIFLDGKLVVEREDPGSWTTLLDPYRTLQPGVRHELRVEFRTVEAGNRCRLFLRRMDLPGSRSRSVWIPEGAWRNLWTGQRIQGPATVKVDAPIDQMPLFVREGGILPLAPVGRATQDKPWNALTLEVWPGPAATAELYEDDGVSEGYRTGAFRRTRLSQTTSGLKVRVDLAPATGTCPAAPVQRSWTVRLRLPAGATTVAAATLDGHKATWRLLKAQPTGMALLGRGPARDGDLVELDVPSSTPRTAHHIEVRFK